MGSRSMKRAKVLAVAPPDAFYTRKVTPIIGASLTEVDIDHHYEDGYISCEATLQNASKHLTRTADKREIDQESDTAPICFLKVKLQSLEEN